MAQSKWKSSTYVDFDIKNHKEESKFKVIANVGMSKCKNILRLKKLKILCHGHLLLVILKMKKLLEEKELQKRVEKVIKKRKGKKLYVKLKGCDSYFKLDWWKKDVLYENELFSTL